MNEHKTSDDIIAEMRSGQVPQHRHDRELLCHYANLFEAALKRERGINFLRFATAEEAAKAWHEHEANDTGEKFCAECPFDKGAVCARDGVCSIGWLYTEAKKGGEMQTNNQVFGRRRSGELGGGVLLQVQVQSRLQ